MKKRKAKINSDLLCIQYCLFCFSCETLCDLWEKCQLGKITRNQMAKVDGMGRYRLNRFFGEPCKLSRKRKAAWLALFSGIVDEIVARPQWPEAGS
jgi:hypothetical protein